MTIQELIPTIITLLSLISLASTLFINAKKGYNKPFERMGSKIDAVGYEVKELSGKISKNTEAVSVLLRERLLGTYTELKQRGWATAREKDEFSKLCERYWGFGFNSFSHNLLEEILSLRDRP